MLGFLGGSEGARFELAAVLTHGTVLKTDGPPNVQPLHPSFPYCSLPATRRYSVCPSAFVLRSIRSARPGALMTPRTCFMVKSVRSATLATVAHSLVIMARTRSRNEVVCLRRRLLATGGVAGGCG